MVLKDSLAQQGDWLFRRRSYLPLVMAPFLILALYAAQKNRVIVSTAWDIFCIGISFTGLGLRGLTVGYVPKNTSNRNTSSQCAQTLNTTGIYATVRHPLYLANFLMLLGVALDPQVWWFTVIFALAFWLYYERIMLAEEEYLRRTFGAAFLRWAERTPTFFPNIRLWQPPILPFSIRTVLKREYSGLFGIVIAFTTVELLRNLITTGTVELTPGWIIFLAAGSCLYVGLRFLRKCTTLLYVQGR